MENSDTSTHGKHSQRTALRDLEVNAWKNHLADTIDLANELDRARDDSQDVDVTAVLDSCAEFVARHAAPGGDPELDQLIAEWWYTSALIRKTPEHLQKAVQLANKALLYAADLQVRARLLLVVGGAALLARREDWASAAADDIDLEDLAASLSDAVHEADGLPRSMSDTLRNRYHRILHMLVPEPSVVEGLQDVWAVIRENVLSGVDRGRDWFNALDFGELRTLGFEPLVARASSGVPYSGLRMVVDRIRFTLDTQPDGRVLLRIEAPGLNADWFDPDLHVEVFDEQARIFLSPEDARDLETLFAQEADHM